MPLAPSSTTCSGAMASTSTMARQRSAKPCSTSRCRACPGAAGVRNVARQRAVAHLLDAAVAAQGQRVAAHDLHAVVLLGIVRGGDDQATVVAVLADGVIEHLRAHEADLVDVAAGVERGLDGGLAELRRGQPHVAADRHRARLELVHVRAHDAVHAVGVQLVGDDAAHVVGLEDRGVQRHARNARSASAARERSTRLGEGLRHHAHVCEHRHEVDVADPARHDVQVQVILDPGAGGRAEVEADVVTLRPERRLESRPATRPAAPRAPCARPRRDRPARRRAGTARSSGARCRRGRG